jgi:hypothetical protein
VFSTLSCQTLVQLPREKGVHEHAYEAAVTQPPSPPLSEPDHPSSAQITFHAHLPSRCVLAPVSSMTYDVAEKPSAGKGEEEELRAEQSGVPTIELAKPRNKSLLVSEAARRMPLLLCAHCAPRVVSGWSHRGWLPAGFFTKPLRW